MAEQEGKYNIKAAALMLGIQPGTLRAWERRYQMIAPVRNASGHRLYTEEHIKILKGLIKKVKQGFTISQAIAMIEQEPISVQPDSLVLNRAKQSPEWLDKLYTALIQFDEAAAAEITNTMFSIFTIEKMVLEVFHDFLLKLEVAYLSGVIKIVQYEFAQQYIYTRVLIISQSLPRHKTKGLLISCSEEGNPYHTLMLTFLFRAKGIGTISIGRLTSVNDAEEIIMQIKPKVIVFSCSKQDDLDLVLSLAGELTVKFSEIPVGLSLSSFQLKGKEKERFASLFVGHTAGEWENWLQERVEM